VLASVAGQSAGQLADISHLSDEAPFWTLLALAAALPVLAHEQTPAEATPEMAQSPSCTTQVAALMVRAPVLQGVALAALVLGFTVANNTNYIFAENRIEKTVNDYIEDPPDPPDPPED
jgi:hypothetical protein